MRDDSKIKQFWINLTTLGKIFFFGVILFIITLGVVIITGILYLFSILGVVLLILTYFALKKKK
jgi:hypothetical protein